jgi:peptide/nickel transport system permease protein
MSDQAGTLAAGSTLPDGDAKPSAEGYWANVRKRLRRDKTTLFFGLVLLLVFLSAIFAPLLAPADPYETSMLNRLKPIGTPGFPLGADELGRDMLTRLLYGGRLSLQMGILPVVNATIIGSVLGLVAGFFGGRINMAIMRTMDVFFAFPSVLLAIAISGALGAGITNTIVSLTIVFTPPITRIAESAATRVRKLDFIEAACATGAGTFSIIRVHVLGNVLAPILIYASSLVSVSIILASGLSFLGLGATPPEPEWGLMLNTLRDAIFVSPWVSIVPGVMIFITSMSFNMLSDGLRHAMDVKM